MADYLEYSDILQEVRGAMNPGRLKLQKDKVIFRNVKTGKVDQYSPSDVDKINWLVRAKGHCLKFVMSSGTIHRYDGFREAEYEKLSSFVKKSYSKELEKKDLSLKGWNWGTANFIGNSLDFEVGGNTSFEVPLNYVSHTTTSKNEVTLEFHQNDEAPMALMELRFHIPTDANNETDEVEEFYKKVMQQADIIPVTGESIAILSEVPCLTPRGRYDIKIYPTFLQLHGKTFDYKIPYTTILRFFLLPHRDGRQMFFVISLDPPIKQGNTRYPFLIFLFSKDMETTLELSLSEEVLAEKYEGKLEKVMQGPEYEIISRIMKTLVNRKITVPGSFMGHSGSQTIACSYKAATGFLYPLERGFMFVHKPPIHIRFDEVSSVNFARSSGSTRSFDFDVETKNGVVFNFVGMEKEEYGKLYDFIAQKKLRVKNTGDSFKKTGTYNDDFDSDEDEDHDAYLERMKAEGQEREDDSSDESSEDEDFVAPESGSEVAEEYDTDFTSSGSEESEENEDGTKKKKEKKRKTITIREPGTQKRKEPKEKKEKKGKKAKKAKKDPNAPKRPQTAYFLWMNENREKINEEFPGLAVSEFGKKAGELWRALEDKSKWEEQHKKLKAEYEEKLKEYKEKVGDEGSHDDESPTASPKAKKKKTAKPVHDTKAGSGAGFKSKEFISDSESEEVSDSDSDEKPLKPKAEKEKKKEKKRVKKEEKEEAKSESDAEAESERTPPKRKKRPREDKADGEAQASSEGGAASSPGSSEAEASN